MYGTLFSFSSKCEANKRQSAFLASPTDPPYI